MQPTDTLDLTKMKRGSAGSRGGLTVTVPATGLSPYSVREKAPLVVSIKSLDQVSYAYGQPFIIHLVLRNTGTQSFAIPWELDPERVTIGPGDPPRMSALLSVAVTRGEGKAVTLPLAVLYGSNANPASVKRCCDPVLRWTSLPTRAGRSPGTRRVQWHRLARASINWRSQRDSRFPRESAATCMGKSSQCTGSRSSSASRRRSNALPVRVTNLKARSIDLTRVSLRTGPAVHNANRVALADDNRPRIGGSR